MRKAGVVVGSLGLQTGAASVVLYLANLAVWSVLTAMLGGAMALIGLGLVIWALYPIRSSGAEEAEAVETTAVAEPVEFIAQARAA